MSNVKLVRVILGLLAALALAAVAAGCGQTGSGAGSAASVVPASALAYVSVDTSFEGGQWRAVSGLLEEFPDGEGLLEDLLERATAEAGLDEGVELQDVLGPEVALVVLDAPAAGTEEAPVVVLTQPDDEDAFAELLEGEDAVRAEVAGWQAVAETDAVLERYREALEAGSIEGVAPFEEAMDDLPADALARVFVNGAGLAEVPVEAFALPLDLAGGSLGAAVVAEDDGIRVEGRAVATGEGGTPELGTFESELVEEVPAGAVAFVAFDGLGEALEAYGDALGMQDAYLPFDPDQVAELLAGEVALYVRPGPAVTLVAEVEDEAEARATVESLLGQALGEAPVVYDVADGLLAVSNSQAELDALRGDGPRLDQDDRFEEALDAAGMPDETSGFGYVDVQAAVPLLGGLEGPGAAAMIPEEYLAPLGGLVFWGEGSGDVQRFSLFLGIG